MTRSIISFTTLIATLVATLAPPAQACGTRYRHSSYSAPRAVRIVRPVTVVRPTVVAQSAVAPAYVAPPENLPTVPTGSQLTLPANFLGQQPGSVFMVFNNIKLPVQIDRWQNTGVTVTLPPMAIKDAVDIRVDIVLPTGKLGHTQKIRVTAPAPVVVHPVRPTSPLPTQAALSISSQPMASQGSPLTTLATGSPFVLPPASGAQPSGPAVSVSPTPLANSLPTASPTANSAPAANASLPGNGTPEQPFILPAAQPQASNAAPATPSAVTVPTPSAVTVPGPPAAQPASAVTVPAPVTVTAPPAQPVAGAADEDAWLDDNPILQEGLLSDLPVESPADPAMDESAPQEIAPPQSSSPVSASGVTTALSVLAQVLLSK